MINSPTLNFHTTACNQLSQGLPTKPTAPDNVLSPFVADLMKEQGKPGSLATGDSRLYTPESFQKYQADCAFMRKLFERHKSSDKMKDLISLYEECNDCKFEVSENLKHAEKLGLEMTDWCNQKIEPGALLGVAILSDNKPFVTVWTNDCNTAYTKGVWFVDEQTVKDALTELVAKGDEKACSMVLTSVATSSGLPANASGLLRDKDPVYCLNLDPNDTNTAPLTSCQFDAKQGFRESVYGQYQPNKAKNIEACPGKIDDKIVQYLQNSFVYQMKGGK